MSSREYFDEVAGDWDKMRSVFFSEKVREKAFEVGKVDGAEVVADIGAGTGFMTEGLVKRGIKVIAVDRSQVMIEEMKRKFSKVDSIDYRIGNAEDLPIEDEMVDCVFANMLLHHIESPAEAIVEMVRILRPGGRLVITDLDQHGFEFLKTEHRDRWMGFKREDVKAWFLRAGLKDVEVASVGENCCATSECGCQRATVSIFVACGKKSRR